VTLQNVAKVRTLGQVELLLTFAISHRFMGERHGRREYLASALVVVGVGLVLALG
jgi:drug/metabolite transporter (DMT)-like permease